MSQAACPFEELLKPEDRPDARPAQVIGAPISAAAAVTWEAVAKSAEREIQYLHDVQAQTNAWMEQKKRKQ